MTDLKICPSCGTSNTSDSRFCGRCGAALAAPLPGAPPGAPSVGAPHVESRVEPSAAAPPQRSPSGTALAAVEPADSKLRTMMMRSSPFETEAAAQEPAAAPTPSGARPPQRTMLGIAMVPTAVGAPQSPGGFSNDEPTTRAHPGHAAPAPAQSPGGFSNDEPTTRAHPPAATANAPVMAAPIATAAVGAVGAVGAVAAVGAVPAAPLAPVANDPSQRAKTMLGISAPWAGLPPAAAAASLPMAAPVQPVPASVQVAPAPQPASIQPASIQPAPAQPAPAAANAPSAQTWKAPVAPPAQQPPAPVAPAPVAAPAAQPAAAQAAGASAKKLGPSQRTMLGVAAPRAAAVESAPSQGRAPTPMPTVGDTAELSIAGMPSPRKRNTGCLLAVLASAILVALGALALFVYDRFAGRGPTAHASVAQTAEGEVIRLELPDAAAGSSVRYGGNTRPVTQGVAELPLAADTLRIGDNTLNVEIVTGNTTSVLPITLTVEYRVRADLAGLELTPATMAVVIEALPGSTATVGGAALTLDAAGRGRLDIPLSTLSAGADGALSHNTTYTVTPPGGQAAQGTLTTRIPMAPLELRHPLDGATTDRASITVAGRTAPAAEGQAVTHVLIEGLEAPTGADGSFRLEVPLPAAGADGLASVRVVARRSGSAPRAVTIAVRRVADLRRAAAEVVVDRSLGYEQLATDIEGARGRLVALEGQVYNADVQDGHGVLQMLVRGCSRPDRCPLWVTYAPADPIESGAVVRVVGVAGGTQQFRAESGETRAVPRIDATYVVPSP